MKKLIFFTIFLPLFTSQSVFASFEDVNEDYIYFKAVNWLQTNGVVNGYEDGTFKPDKLVNRAEFVKMLYEAKGENGYYMGKPLQPFLDVSEDAWYGGYLTKAYLDAVIDGYEGGTFKPEQDINLAEAMKIVVNGFLKYKDFSDEFIKGMEHSRWPCKYYDVHIDDFFDKEVWYAKYLLFADTSCIIPKPMLINDNEEIIFDPSIKLTRAQMAELIYRAKAVFDFSSFIVMEDGDYAKSVAVYFNEIEPSNLFCTAQYQYDENGYTRYLIDPVYRHLPYLGQLFTADDCGEERVVKMYGVDDDNYTLGINLFTKGAPSFELLDLLQELGFQCPQGVGIEKCTQWILNSPIKVEDILKLKEFHQEISEDSCKDCKME